MKSTSSSSTSRSDKQQIPADEAFRTLQSGLEKVDLERGLAYGSLAQLRAAKGRLLERHQSLLARKLGPEHPRVRAQQIQGDLIKAQHVELRAAQAQTLTPVPRVQPAGHAVHGFVRTAEREPIPNAVVAVYDESGKKRQDFGHTATDAKGYFLLTTSQLSKGRKVDSKGETEPREPVGLEVRVFAGRTMLQHFAPAVSALPGQASFREILVVSETKPASAPPANVEPNAGAAPVYARSAKPGATLKSIAEGLRQKPRSDSGETTSAAAGRQKKASRKKSGRAPAKKKKTPKKKKDVPPKSS